MDNINRKKRGSAIALCLIFATVLLTMGLAFSKLTENSKKQTVTIDDKIKLEFLAAGLAEIAVLKYQMFPSDYYNCQENYNAIASKSNIKKKSEAELDKIALLQFGVRAKEFKDIFRGNVDSNSTFNNSKINLELASMTIITENKWNNEVLYIEATADYDDKQLVGNGEKTGKTVTRLLQLERKTIKQ